MSNQKPHAIIPESSTPGREIMGAELIYTPDVIAILFKEFVQSKGTLKSFCAKRGLVYDKMSGRFAEYRRECRELAIGKLDHASARAADVIVDNLENSDDDASMDAAKEVLNRVGITSQAAVIQINNNNSNTIIIPPLFAAEDAMESKKMFEKTIDVYPNSDGKNG